MYVFCFSKYVIDETGGSYMDAVVEILKGLDYSPLYVSLKTGIVATIFFYIILFRNLCGEKSGKDNTGQEGGH